MHGMSIVNAFPIVAAFFSRVYEVEVLIGGNEACTDCKSRITIPELDWFNPEHVTMAWGYLYHEIFHIVFTEPEQARPFIKTALTKEIANIFEDIRIEQAGFKRHPTVEPRMAQMCYLLVKNGYEGKPEASEEPVDILTAYLLYKLRAEILKQDCYDAYALESEVLIRETFATETLTGIDAIMARVKDTQSAGETAELAMELINLLKLESEKPEKPKDRKKANLKQALNASKGDIACRDPMAIIKGLLEKASQSAQASGLSAGVAKAKPLQAVKPYEGETLVAQVRQSSNALRFALESFIQAETEEDVSHSRHGRRMDAQRLHLVPTGHTEVFRHVIREEGENTAVMVLFDRSGSMESILPLARDCVLSLNLALDGLEKVQVASAAFPSARCKTGVIELTRFDEHPGETAARYAALTASGGTPMAEAILWGTRDLLEAHNPRKVMFVISDGLPFNVDATRNIIQASWNDGIEVYAVIIKTKRLDLSQIETLFGSDHYVVVAQISELQAKLFELARIAFRRVA